LQQAVALHDFVIKVGQRLNIIEIIFIHYQRKPKAQLGNFNRAGVEINTI
jgi:hypothetical protein